MEGRVVPNRFIEFPWSAEEPVNPNVDRTCTSRRAHTSVLSVCCTIVIVRVFAYNARVKHCRASRRKQGGGFFSFLLENGTTARNHRHVTYSASVVATLAISAGRKLLCWLGG